MAVAAVVPVIVVQDLFLISECILLRECLFKWLIESFTKVAKRFFCC